MTKKRSPQPKKKQSVCQQQQLPNNCRFRGVWGDLDVDDLTSTCKLANRDTASNQPHKTFFKKKNILENCFAKIKPMNM